MFADVPHCPEDAILRLIALYRQDQRDDKIDLGVGVYKDEAGVTPVMAAVKAAEARLQETQPSKAYLGSLGNVAFSDALFAECFSGDGAPGRDTVAACQSLGGTGALFLAAELVRMARPGATVWVGTPTWPNHLALFRSDVFEVKTYRHFEPAEQKVDFDTVLGALDAAAAGDVFILHGGCHNPSGADFTDAQWDQIGEKLADKGLLPVVDIAYAGFHRAFRDDFAPTRRLAARLPELVACVSCSKNFGLYRDRIGAVFAFCETPEAKANVESAFAVIARAAYSMPADHGASVVLEILGDPGLKALWTEELDSMRARLRAKRDTLESFSNACPALAGVSRANGMFSLLPLSKDQVVALRERRGVYMTEGGRINVAGLTDADAERLVEALKEVAG